MVEKQKIRVTQHFLYAKWNDGNLTLQQQVNN